MSLTWGSAATTSPVAHADDVSDQQEQIRRDLAEIERLEEKASQLNEQYLGYLNEQSQLEAEIAASQQQIDAGRAELATLQSHLAELAIQQFTGGGGSAGLGLFGDLSTATDGMQREQLLRAAVDAGSFTTDDYEALLDDLDDQQRDLEAKQERAGRLAEQAAATLAATEQAGRDYQDELARDQAVLGDLLVQEQQRQAAEAQAKHEAEVAAAQAARAAADAAVAATTTTTDAPQTSGSGSPTTQAADAPATTQAPNEQAPATTSAPATTAAPRSTAPATTEAPATTVDQSFGADEEPAEAGDDAGGGGGAAEADAPPPVSSRAQVAVAAARAQLGVPYKFAMSSPGVAFDCSGLTAYAWEQAGVRMPHQSAMQYASTPHVAVTDVQPGDLLFFYSPISHVSMYIGNGMQIHAPAPGKTVEIVAVNWGRVVGASRPG